MSTQQDVLAAVELFGNHVAEDELTALWWYFVRTDQYNKLIKGDVDIIYGPKGSGKSALYALLFSDESPGKPEVDERIHRIGVVNPKDASIFEEASLDEHATENDFRHLWKLYFLALLASYLRDLNIGDSELRTKTKEICELLVQAELIPEKRDKGWKAYWSSAVSYIKQHLPVFSVEMKSDSGTGAPTFAGRMSFSEPTAKESSSGHISIDTALRVLTDCLESLGLTVWIGLDRLDAAFADNQVIETKALKALFRVYIDWKAYKNLRLKIFLRDDIWTRITEKGFPEASHLSRFTIIRWDKNSLLNLIIKRVMQSQVAVNYYSAARSILDNIHEQQLLFDRIFPVRMSNGKREIDTLDWMISKIQDATAGPCPRELLHLIQAGRRNQMRAYEHGIPPPQGTELIGERALRDALIEVSEFRFTNTFCAEHPQLSRYARKLSSKKATQTLATLAVAFDTAPDTTADIAERMARAGFFAEKRTRQGVRYTVPYLYRSPLRIRE